MTRLTQTLKDILAQSAGKKFDVCLMNPPYGAKEDGNYLDIKFLDKVTKISDKIISIQPAKLASNASLYKNFFNRNIIETIDLLDPYESFGISPFGAYKYVGIYTVNSNKTFNKLNLNLGNKIFNIENTLEEREKFSHEQNWNKNIIKLIETFENLRNTLFSKYKTMVNDGHGFIYEENRLNRGKTKYGVNKKNNKSLDKVKEYLKSKEYKYCIYKGSGNNSYDKPQEWLGQDPDKLFKGQICWLTNNKTVKDNIIYWMECPLFDLWRIYYFNHLKYSVGCLYGDIPALDFEMNESDFKKYVDSLNDFTDDEIKILKENNIHNADKL